MNDTDIAQKALRFSKYYNLYQTMKRVFTDDSVDPNNERDALVSLSIILNTIMNSYVSRLMFRLDSVNHEELEEIVKKTEGTDTKAFEFSFIHWKAHFNVLRTITAEMREFALKDDTLFNVYSNILMDYNRKHPKPF